MSNRTAIRRGHVPKQPKRRVAKRASSPRMVRIPIAPGRLGRVLSTGVALLLAVGAGTALWLGGEPQRVWQSTAEGVANAGFEVRHVEVRGLEHLAKLPVYAATLDGASNSMLTVDLSDARERLRQLPWVADASVARRLPDTLVVDVIERKPVAIWQYRQKLAVVDAEGRVLDTKRLERFAALPMIVGPRANAQTQTLMAMLADYPDVRGRVNAATWIGDRRWDLRFKGGETLALPEGPEAARTALANFARMDGEGGLLDKGFVRFDMRLPDKMVVRVSGEPGAQALPLTPASAATEI